MKKLHEWLAVAVLLIVCVGARSYKITAPLADWHSWREADTAAVARNFVKAKFDLLYPQSDSLLALNEAGLPNPNRYFINEFPFYNAVVAVLYKMFGVNTAIGRGVSIFFAALGAFFLYLLTRKLAGVGIALLALGYYALNPYNIYYGRFFTPDPTFVALSIISLYWCVRWVESKKLVHGLLLMVAFGLAMLVKPYAAFMAIPIAYWVLINWKMAAFRRPDVYLVALGSFLPLVLWRYHLSLHPEASFASTWLMNGDGIRFKGSFFRWIIFDRFNRLIFATGGFVLFVVGFLSSYMKKNYSFFFVWALAVLTYITVFAKGNVNHDYYQLPIMPVGAVLVALGSAALIKMGKTALQKWVNGGFVGILLILSLAFGWFEVRGFFNINNPAIVEAGTKVDEITEKDALVIADYQGDPAFLYQTNRYGWPIGGDVEGKIEEGADYYVTTSFNDDFNRLKSKYPVIFQNDVYAIIKLQPHPDPSMPEK